MKSIEAKPRPVILSTEPVEFTSLRGEERQQNGPRVLFIQPETDDFAAEAKRRTIQELARAQGVTLVPFLPVKQNLGDTSPRQLIDQMDGVFISGGSVFDLPVETPERDTYFSNAADLIKTAVKKGMRLINPLPVLGICLGHQLIHHFTNGKVERAEDKHEASTIKVVLNRHGKKDQYVRGIQTSVTQDGETVFNANAIHKDTATKFKVLGTSSNDIIALTKSRIGKVRTAHFHPEHNDGNELTELVHHTNAQLDNKLGRYNAKKPFADTPGNENILIAFFRDVKERYYRKFSQKPILA